MQDVLGMVYGKLLELLYAIVYLCPEPARPSFWVRRMSASSLLFDNLSNYGNEIFDQRKYYSDTPVRCNSKRNGSYDCRCTLPYYWKLNWQDWLDIQMDVNGKTDNQQWNVKNQLVS